MRSPLIVLAIIIAALASGAGAVEVGDKPSLHFTAIDGAQVDLQKLRGNLVVVNFWSVSDASKRAEQQLVELQHNHGDDGVKLIDICCARDLLQAKAMIKQLGLTWPQ